MADEKKKVPSPVELLGGKKKSAKKSGKKKHRTTTIEHHDDGSHTVRHLPMDGGPETSYAAADLGAVHAGLDKNVGGEPDGDEGAPAGPPVMPPGGGAA